MKKLFSLIITLLIFNFCFSQKEKPHKPMGSNAFKSYYKKIDKQKNDEQKIKKGVKALRFNHISSNQAYKVCLLFDIDNNRLIYINQIYPKISDKSNAIIICDAFENFSHSQMLWDFIEKENQKYNVPKPTMKSYAEYLQLKDKKKDKQKDDHTKTKIPKQNNNSEKLLQETEVSKNEDLQKKPQTETAKPKEKPKEIKNEPAKVEESVPTAKIIFPDATIYIGKTGCEQYLNNKTFLAFYNSLEKLDSDEQKTKACMEYINKYCFSVSQMMVISNLIKKEKFKFILFKTSLEHLYDTENFLNVKQLINEPSQKEEIDEIYITFINKKNIQDQLEKKPNKKPCKVSEQELTKIKSTIRKEFSDENKMKMAKFLLKQNECFNTEQIKELIRLFNSDSDKLELAKYAYEFCTDRKEYINIKKLFITQKSKDELQEYLINYED